jgi:hypothetical protein
MQTSFNTYLELYLPEFIKKIVHNYLDKKRLSQWYANGCPVPPPHIVKQQVITEYQQKTGYATVVITHHFKS